ncbi:MAG TPA: hypothetical protein VIJ41_16615 [Candidatus Nanopelagicales bacterium]
MSGRHRALQEIPGLADLFAGQQGLARRSQLSELGVSRDHVARQVAAGRWQLLAPEVVAADNGRIDDAQLRWRAVLHATCGWLGGHSALHQLGLTGYEPERIHVLVPRDRRPAPLPDVVVHVTDRVPGPPPELREGLAVTGAARAAVDGAAWERWPRAAAVLVLSAVQQRLVSPADVLAELAGAGRVRHRAVVRDAMAEAGAGADSLAEIDVLPLLRRAGLPSPRRQVEAHGHRRDLEVTLADGSVLVIEIDGPAHDNPESRWADAARDTGVAADGKLLVRIPSFAVRRRQLEVVTRLTTIRRAAEERVAAAQPPPAR